VDTALLAREYEAHAARKEAAVRETLAAAGMDALFEGLVRCPVERGFRTQASFRVRGEPGREPAVLGVDPRTPEARVSLEDALWVIPEEARPAVARVGEIVRRAAPAGEVTGFGVRLEHGSLRPHLELAVRRDVPWSAAPLVSRLVDEVPALLGVSVPSQGIETGEAWLRNRLAGKTVLAHHLAFFQTNAHVTPWLVDEVGRALAGAETVVDLYCGVGMHSVLAARPETVVEGADNNRWAIEGACRNAELHGLANARYHRATAERFCRERSFRAPDAVVVNPSRFGCGPGIPEAVAGWRPGAVCLVSCSVHAHARDALAFARAGYRPVSVRCFDMFPFSEYLESVSVFRPA
jgi:tRNA/tmRNA/rRNA uracil-C5-methylase (TrmA/RlmC/RlmD family)